jgi:AcrR family transcriptional regulator
VTEPVPRRRLVRGEPVIRRVLAAALGELGKVGYGALRVEDVAARANVNKTTVYRRWATKEELIRAALLTLAEEQMRSLAAPDTGSLIEDLRSITRQYVELLDRQEHRVLRRVLTAEQADPEVSAIARSLQLVYDTVPLALLERAAKRGELRPDVDHVLLFELLKAGCSRPPKSFARAAQVVDLLLLGALNPRSSRR